MKEIMSFRETFNAAHNINSIEHYLGHKIPAGMLDVNSLGKEIMSVQDTVNTAHNLRMVEMMRSPREISFIEKVMVFYGGLGLIAFGIAALYVLAEAFLF